MNASAGVALTAPAKNNKMKSMKSVVLDLFNFFASCVVETPGGCSLTVRADAAEGGWTAAQAADSSASGQLALCLRRREKKA